MTQFEKRTNLFQEYGFKAAQLPALKNYVDLLWQSNESLNLISRKMTFEELIDNHVLDCIIRIPHFPKNVKSVADFGSGGGLPGVIYALQFPETAFHFYEKSPKKREFLEKCRTLCPNITLHSEIPLQLPGVELVTARAFKPLDVILDMSRKYYESGGHYFLLKGRKEKIAEEIQDSLKKFKDLKTEIIPVKSPLLDVERHILKI